MLRIKRYFIIDKHHQVKKCIGKKDYDYPKSKGDFNHLVNVLKSWENFQKQQLNFDTNINCIIIKSGIKL